MATNSITTSLVVSFGDPDDALEGHLSAEIDARPEGFNKGVTSFIPGDSPAYLVYKTPNVVITQIATAGSISSIGSVQVEVSEIVTFAKTREGSLSKPPLGGVSWTPYGGSGYTPSVSGTKLTVPEPIIAVYKAVFTTLALAYRIVGVGVPSVLIFIEGTITS